MSNIVCNTRATTAPLAGVQRYILAILESEGASIDTVRPEGALQGARGHLWEQLVLPRLLRSRLLWSPSNVSARRSTS